jgi:putative ABC transport system permease protein
MIRNYLKIALRNIQSNKLFSFINVFGLAIGLTCCLLISMYLYKEFSYDTQHELGKRIYQVGSINIQEGKESRFSTTAAPLAAAMQQEFPEVERTVRLMKLFQEDKTLLQYDPGNDLRSFLRIPWLYGGFNFF